MIYKAHIGMIIQISSGVLLQMTEINMKLKSVWCMELSHLPLSLRQGVSEARECTMSA